MRIPPHAEAIVPGPLVPIRGRSATMRTGRVAKLLPPAIGAGALPSAPVAGTSSADVIVPTVRRVP